MDEETDNSVQLPDYYAVLGVAADADKRTIERAYDRLARMFQPYTDEPPVAREAMRRLDEAFDVLDVPAKRAEYDRALTTAGQTSARPPKRLLGRPEVRVATAACILGVAIASVVGFLLIFSGDDDTSGAAPIYPLQIVAPLNGTTVTSPVTIEVASTHLIAAPELNVPGALHYHIFVDKIPFTAAGQTIPMDEEGVYHFAESTLQINLDPGFHNLTLVLGDNSHVRIHGPEAPALAVDIIVVEASPTQ